MDGFNVRITCIDGNWKPKWPYAKPVPSTVLNVTLVPGEPVPAIPWNPDYGVIAKVEIEAVSDSSDPEWKFSNNDVDEPTGS